MNAKISISEKDFEKYQVAKESRSYSFSDLIPIALRELEKQRIRAKKDWTLEGFLMVQLRYHMNNGCLVPDKIALEMAAKINYQKTIRLIDVEKFGAGKVNIIYQDLESDEIKFFRPKSTVVSEEIYDIIDRKELLTEKIEKEISNHE